MTITAPNAPTTEDASRWLADTLSTLACGDADGFFGGITWSEATSMADWLHAHGNPVAAGYFMAEWAANDSEWEAFDENGEVSAYFLLIPEDRRESALRFRDLTTEEN